MKRFNVETAVGLFVILGIAALAWLSIRLGKLEIVTGDYVPVHAEFASVAGLKKGASVEIAGVPVGKVDAVVLDGNKADVRMKIRKGIGLGDDTVASVRTMGLIGDRYISLSPGASDRMIPPGGKVRETESPPDLDQLIAELIHGNAK
ncbi:MAG: outer membrane lipid asymmetry maintenance protein MlaD [Deltaproteobacteria bacterium]